MPIFSDVRELAARCGVDGVLQRYTHESAIGSQVGCEQCELHRVTVHFHRVPKGTLNTHNRLQLPTTNYTYVV